VFFAAYRREYGQGGTAIVGNMNNGVELHIRLDEFVMEMAASHAGNPFRASCFGLEREGSYIHPWQMNYQRIGYYSNAYMLCESGGDSFVRITVLSTETGIAPSPNEPQPFGWSGKINEYSAELAVWWSFDLADEGEARCFMRQHRPVVIFEYFDNGRYYRLETRFNGTFWFVERFQ
jgi:hypothetical protein